MNTYKAIVQYKGTQYNGFQIQPSAKTIQGELNEALKKLSQSENIKTIGSGRTDAGVHAFGQVVKIEIPVLIPEESFARALNSHLPTDIRVTMAEFCAPDFHPIFQAKSKEYHYLFTTLPLMSPFAHELITSFPYQLDIDLMNKGAALLVGKHDFCNYQCTGTDVETSVREIFRCEIERSISTNHWEAVIPDYYTLKIEGNGFLKQMVRLIMGALWNLGRGKITLEELEKSLKTPLASRLGATAPAQGLYLMRVHY